MKSLNSYLILAIGASMLLSCAASRNNTAGNPSDDVRPIVKTPGRSIINASGDGLTPSASPLNSNIGTGADNSVSISNNAINHAKGNPKGQIFRLDSISDQDFVRQAAAYVMMENNISKIAQDKSDISDIRTYSKTILNNHGQLQSDLKKLSSNLNMSIPDTNNTNINLMQSLASKSNGTSGSASEFNFKYVQLVIDGHRNAIQLFESAARSRNLKVVDFANKYLPILKTNLTEAQELTKSVSPVKPKN